MIRVLLHTDTPCLYSGLARCGRELAKIFFEAQEIVDGKTVKKFDFAYAGWHHQPKRHEYPYFIYPVGKGGKHEAAEFKTILEDFAPDIVISIGDIWNFSNIQDAIANFKEKKSVKWILWLTVDGENWHPAWGKILNFADRVYSFSEFGQEEIKRIGGFTPEVVYPGVDKNIFKKISVDFNVTETTIPFKLKDTFIVLNVNQNTDRKNLPLTIEAFSEFAKDKEDVFLLLVTDPEDRHGFDIWNFIDKFNLKKKSAVTKETGPLKGMSDQKLNLIYNLSSVLVNTSIGEGLSLPIIEAMAVGLPVVATDYAAVSEIINKGGGFKIDIAAYMYGFNGIKRALVSKESLVKYLNTLYNDFKSNKNIQTSITAQEKVFTDLLTWENTAKVFISAVEHINQEKTVEHSFIKSHIKLSDIKPLVIIPSWGKNCGIAEYTKSLLDAMSKLKQSATVFPSYLYSEIKNLIKKDKYNLIHIQHEFSFFQNDHEFVKLFQDLNESKVKIILTMHSLVKDLTPINNFILTHSDNVIVHCEMFKEILKQNSNPKKDLSIENINNIEMINMGCGDIFEIDDNRMAETKKALNLAYKFPIIGSFGFLREQKGYHHLLLAIKELKKQYENILLLIVAPSHEFGSKAYDESFFNFIIKHELENNILIIREYLKEEKLLAVLQCADLFVLNYIDSTIGGGISAAVKTLFRVQRPVLVREGIAFSDLTHAEVLKIRDESINALAYTINTMIEDKNLTSSLVKNANEFLLNNSWKNVAQKHIDLYNS